MNPENPESAGKAVRVLVIDMGTEMLKGLVMDVRRESDAIDLIKGTGCPAIGMARGGVADMGRATETLERVRATLAWHTAERGGVPLPPATVTGTVLGLRQLGLEYTFRADIGQVGDLDHLCVPEGRRRLAAMPPPDGSAVLNLVARAEPVGGLLAGPDGGLKTEVRARVTGVAGDALGKALLDACVTRAQLLPGGFVLRQLAAARALLTPVEARNGVLLVELGAGTTGVTVVSGGEVRLVDYVPLGGQDLIETLALLMGTDYRTTQMLLVRNGAAHPFHGDPDAPVDLPKGKLPAPLRTMPRREFNAFVESVLGTIFERVVLQLRRCGLSRACRGVVVTGGLANLRGIRETADKHLGEIGPVRVGYPWLTARHRVMEPQYAALVGAALLAADRIRDDRSGEMLVLKLADRETGPASPPDAKTDV